MITLRFHPDAERELLAAHSWYRERSEVAAQAFALEIDHALSAIADAPARWPLQQRGDRRLTLSRFPYSVFYRLRAEEVFVVAIAHQRRLPGYWRHRR
jgi:plasmid stabilization system protein ParE